MYIDMMRLPAPSLKARLGKLPRLAMLCAGLAAASLTPMLNGCDLFGSSKKTPLTPKPAVLNPEIDAFLDVDLRTYHWVEELQRTGKPDSVVGFGTSVVKSRDTVISGLPRPHFDVAPAYTDSNPAPAAFFTRLGFRPSAVHYDTARVPDPGASLRFPVAPVLGWRLDTTFADLRFVRVLTGTAVIERAGFNLETWAFAESTWWNEGTPVLLGTGTTWMGRTGLAGHQSVWTDFTTPAGTGTLMRTITAP